MTEKNLLSAHAKIQTGTYFDAISTLGNNLSFAYSDTIQDYYWNYAFFSNESFDYREEFEKIKNFAVSINREPFVYLSKDLLNNEKIAELVEPIEEEAWLVFNNDIAIITSINEINTSSKVTADFLTVFENAYGGGEKESPGYHGLPAEYVQAVKKAAPKNDQVKLVHLVKHIKSEPVAIASVYMNFEFAGIYNVGTIFKNRRQGLAKEISLEAVKIARGQGAKFIFLQTKPNSEVEEMYIAIGFRRQFIGAFCKIKF